MIAIPTSMAYNMAKAAIDHMARTAAIELARRPHPRQRRPSRLDRHAGRAEVLRRRATVAGGEVDSRGSGSGKPEEIGKLVAFMMSPDCDYMTGSTVLMDGGISLPWWSNRAEGQQ